MRTTNPSTLLLAATLHLASSGLAEADANADASTAFRRGDYAVALKIWEPLAEQGDPVAQFGLGSIYASGRGVPKDPARGVAWMRRAAEGGHSSAALMLGLHYEGGFGVAADPVQAHKWMNIALALARSNIEAANARLLLTSHERIMTADQLAEGRSLASEWLNAHSISPSAP